MTEFQELTQDAPNFVSMERGELVACAYGMFAAGTKADAENAKLRELVRDYIDAPCTTCDCWQDEFRCWNYDGADCGLVARAHDLGVEVDG